MCATPGCHQIVAVGEKRCPTHSQAHNLLDSRRRNAKPTMRIYTSTRWRGPKGTRTTVLERDHHTCQLCGHTATHVDHQPPITELQALGLDPYDPQHCRALCASCAGRADAHRAHQ
jgi:5-methylcytosine-specific restriction endonuclease McrA